MFQNNITIAWRNLRREKFFSTLNILGLATALTCAAYITVWIWDEWRHDRYFDNASRIVRVTNTFHSEKETFDQAVTSVQIAPNMKIDFPEVADYCRLDDNEIVVKTDNQQFAEKGILTADSTFFKVFNYNLQSGNPQKALTEPYTIVLTEKTAQKYFGEKDPIGQTLKLNLYDDTGEGKNYRVTGILEGEARPGHFHFDGLVSFTSFFDYNPNYLGDDGWDESGYYTYLLLQKDAPIAKLEAKMPDFFKKHLQERYGDKFKVEFHVQPISDIYLHSDRRYEMAANGNAKHLYIFGTVGLLILFVAGINYINMSTARASRRARNVGVRKALGAQRGQLMVQFLLESVLTTLLAASVALILGKGLQPAFEALTGKPLGLFDIPYLTAGIIGVAMVLGLLAGIYPAAVLSGYRPAAVLKGSSDGSAPKSSNLRQALVVVQFVISIALIVSVLVVQQQMNFIQQKDLGFQKEAVLTLKVISPAVLRGVEAFRNDITANNTLIQGMTIANTIPVGGTGNSSARTVDHTGKPIETSTYRMRADYNYVPVMGLKLLAGRNFSPDYATDFPTDTTQNYIMNAAAVRAFGWKTPEEAIGKPFRTHGKQGQVIGIVEDFHFNSLKHKVEPLAIHLNNGRISHIILRINMERSKEAITAIEAQWAKHFPGEILHYAFLDEQLDQQYRSELRFGALFRAFSLFSIFIACLGLFGLAAYTAERRTKEIGIRKVLGASVLGITGMLARDFVKLVCIALLIASPLAYYFMEKWLTDFAYRVDIQWWVFIAAGAIAICVAFLTVGGQALKAALANPVQSLKSE